MKRGGVFFSIGAFAVLTHTAAAAVPAQPPLPDHVQRLIEEERRLRQQQMQANPATGIGIQLAQEINAALNLINLKAQNDRLIIQGELVRAQKAESVQLAAGHYETCLAYGNAFRRYAAKQLEGILDDANNPRRRAAMDQLQDIMSQVQVGYVKNRMAMASAYQQRREYDLAKRVISSALRMLPDNLDLQHFARGIELAEADYKRRSPSNEVHARALELKERDEEIRKLLTNGKFYFELRDFDSAEDQFERVLLLDESNDVADNYIRIIGKERKKITIMKRDREFRRRVYEVDKEWDPPTHQRTLPQPNPEWQRRTMKGAAGNAVGGAGSNNSVFQKLQSIRIPRMEPLHDFSLAEAVQLVSTAAKINDDTTDDPVQKGVNMSFSTRLPAKNEVNVSVFGGQSFGPAFTPPRLNENGVPELNRFSNTGSMATTFGTGGNGTPGTARTPQTGAPTPPRPAATPDFFDPRKVKVHGLTTPLENLTLGQLIGAITDACDHPVKYSVRNGILVFEYRQDDLSMETRKFTIKPNAFWQNLAGRSNAPVLGKDPNTGLSTFDKRTNDGTKWSVSGTASAASGGGGAGGGGVINNTALGQQIQQYFQGLGITAPQVFINPSNGQLLVRAPLADLDLIDQAIQILNSSPEQLYIEAKFAEIEFNDGESMGFDWYLGNSTMMGDKIVHGAGPHPTYIGRPTENNPSGFFPYPGTLVGNQFIPSQYSIQPSPNEGRLTSSFKGYGNPLWTFTGIMTDPQFRVVLNAISQQEGAELLSAPEIIAISGQQAQIQVQDQRNIVTGVQPTFTPGAGGGGFGGAGGAGGGTVTPVVSPQQMGPSLSVLPYVNSDGYTIEMSLAPQITEFLGYEESTFEAAVFAAGGNVVRSAVPMPRIRTRTITVQCVVWDQTVLALGGLISENVQTTRDKVPLLGDLPFVGKAFRGRGRNSKKKNMVIYVKPTIIDPAGRKKNNPNQMPFARTEAPNSVGFIPPNDPNAIGQPGGGAPLNKVDTPPATGGAPGKSRVLVKPLR